MKNTASLKLWRHGLCLLLAALLLAACADQGSSLNAQAQRYVLLALALDQLHPGEVDAYFGPDGLRQQASEQSWSLDAIHTELQALRSDLVGDDDMESQEPEQNLRRQTLLDKVDHLTLLVALRQSPGPRNFVAEAQQVYGIDLQAALSVPADEGPGLLAELDALLAGTGSLPFRVASFRNGLSVPADRREAVFEAALAACRVATDKFWDLPEEETLALEWSRQVSAAWHHYLGEGRSRLTLNPLTLAYMGILLDVACHEAYPGHHAQFLLWERAAGEAGLALEDQVVMLRSRETLLREAAANYGIRLAFDEAERLKLEGETLFPLAGLPVERVETQAKVHALLKSLGYIALPILRDYYDGELSFNNATFRLEREALISTPTELLRYVDEFGPYSVGYTWLEGRLAAHIEANSDSPEQAWALLREAILEPGSYPWAPE